MSWEVVPQCFEVSRGVPIVQNRIKCEIVGRCLLTEKNEALISRCANSKMKRTASHSELTRKRYLCAVVVVVVVAVRLVVVIAVR